MGGFFCPLLGLLPVTVARVATSVFCTIGDETQCQIEQSQSTLLQNLVQLSLEAEVDLIVTASSTMEGCISAVTTGGDAQEIQLPDGTACVWWLSLQLRKCYELPPNRNIQILSPAGRILDTTEMLPEALDQNGIFSTAYVAGSGQSAR